MAAKSHSDHPTNRLAAETSPYLLQHQRNPVDWYSWGAEALETARKTDRPIFLSIGYSACHWCHDMERESFENEATAALMNEHFINVKVDREERPDLDNIYMAAVQAMTGHGGWPMSVFLTPDLKPFFGGTYYPPVDGRGMPSFSRVLLSVSRAWRERRSEIEASAGEMAEQLRSLGAIPANVGGKLTFSILDDASRSLCRSADPIHGGFGSAPKFPHPMDLRVLLRQYSRTGDAPSLQVVRQTLDKMARGGIQDHLAGGFARYSTDERWLVPHFEKMLYDNALLSTTYLEAYQVTKDPEYARVAQSTLDYILTRMTSPDGGFYATEDADSEGVEGKFYVWSLDEVRQVLGPERAEMFASVYDVTKHGNWEESNILNLPRPIEAVALSLGKDTAELRASLAQDRAELLKVRERRIPPAMDTKILTSWNGLMMAPLAEGSRILGVERYLEAASRAASFLLKTMVGPDGRLRHSFKDGQAKFNGYLDDYANLIDGLTRVFEAGGDSSLLEAASKLADTMIAEFADPDGGFFYTGRSHEELIVRTKDVYDNATPSSNAMAATALLRLAALSGSEVYQTAGEAAIRSVLTVLDRAPAAAGQSLIALDFLLSPTKEFAVIAPPGDGEFRAILETIASRFLPHKVVAPDRSGGVGPGSAPRISLLVDRPVVNGRATTYICERQTCQAPVTGVAGLLAALG